MFKALLQPIETRIDKSIGRQNLGYILLGFLVLYFLWFPQDSSQSNYAKTVFISGFFYAILASSWALLAGIAGQFSFGHMAFMGICAYVTGLIARDGIGFLGIEGASFPTLVAILIGTIVTGLVGLVIGWLLLRLRSSYLALFTIAFSELFRIVMLTEYDYTGGSNGLSLRRLVVTSDVDAARRIEYYIMFGLLVLSLALMYWISNSRIGMFLRAMREDEEAASSLGVNVVFYKIIIFVITGMIVGLAGSVFFSDVGSERVIPEQLEILQMSLVIAYAVIGGMESLLGAAAGAFISRYLLENLRQVSLPVTITFDGGVVGLMTLLILALAVGLVGAWAENHERIKAYKMRFRSGYIVAAIVIVLLGTNITNTPSTWNTGFWRFAVFGIIMVLTLRYMRNGLLYPILQWFSGRDADLQETVSIRNDSDDDTLAEDNA
ncbi:MAG: branched-chain amino acid ABC transporter permease [Anaerolineae bacterium]|nr:branched-chain amino acid ABC transporter permease [Anaerolineae bacterium]